MRLRAPHSAEATREMMQSVRRFALPLALWVVAALAMAHELGTGVALAGLAPLPPEPPNGRSVQRQDAAARPPAVLGITARAPAVTVLPRAANTGPAPVRRSGAPDPRPSADSLIVVDGDSGAVLFERNGYVPAAPASTTKVMTAILGIEYGRLDDPVQLDVDAGAMPGSSLMGLEPWFHVRFEDLLYGLMLSSGNDAAVAIARHVAGSDEEFVRMMNEKAAWLGLRATHFSNPHGLDESDHYSCPHDLVLMARYGMQYPVFRKIAATRTYNVESDNLFLVLRNLNPLLNYPGADGVKTGLTDSAGRALVGTAVRDGHRVYVAFIRSENGVAADGPLLLDWAFDSFDWPDPRVEAAR